MKFNYEQLLGALQGRVAEEGEDYVYAPPSGCVYVHDGAPSCLIGCALYDLGISLDELAEHDLHGGYSALALPYWADERTKNLATKVQSWQDERYTWGDSVANGIK